MKKFFALLSFCMVGTCANLSAQNAWAVYFESGSFELSTQAQNSLDSLAQTLKNTPKARLSLAAYTDDRGNPQINQRLAKLRAESVAQYLQTYPFELKNTSYPKPASAYGQTPQELAAFRAQQRRVEISVHIPHPPTALDSVLTNMSQNTNQFFICEKPANPVQVVGKKGTILGIPANAFVVKGSQIAPVAPIRIELREAYTFGEMIAHNLSTLSGTELIQTGGMVYIAAKDAKGRELTLAPQKTILLDMPSKKELPKDMQVFTATRAGDDNVSSINWLPTNNFFVSSPAQNRPRVANTTPQNGLQNENPNNIFLDRKLLARLTNTVPLWEIDKSFVNKYPRRKPIKISPLKVFQNDLGFYLALDKKEAAKKSFETPEEHKARIAKLYEQAYKKYAKEKAKFEATLENKILPNLRPSLSVQVNNFQTPKQIIDDLNKLVACYKLKQFEPELQKLTKAAKKINPKHPIFKAKTHYENLTRFVSRNDVFVNSLLNTYKSDGKIISVNLEDKEQLTNLGYFSEHTAAQIGMFSTAICRTFANAGYWAQQAEIQEAYNEFARHDCSEVNEILKNIEKLRVKITEDSTMQQIITDYLNSQTVFDLFANQAAIQGLGWINCDRFMGLSKTISFTIPVSSHTLATNYYLILPNFDAILPLDASNQGLFVPNIPKNTSTKLVGFRAQGENFEYCENVSKTEELKNAKIEFIPLSKSEFIKKVEKL